MLDRGCLQCLGVPEPRQLPVEGYEGEQNAGASRAESETDCRNQQVVRRDETRCEKRWHISGPRNRNATRRQTLARDTDSPLAEPRPIIVALPPRGIIQPRAPADDPSVTRVDPASRLRGTRRG